MRYPGLAFCLLAFTTSHAELVVTDTGTHRLHKISDHVYAASPTYSGSNALLVIDPDFVLVVDSHSSPAGAAALIDSIKSLTDVPVRYVVNTHWHTDHHSGNEAYRDAFPNDVVFISHDTTREDIPTLGREQFEQVSSFRLDDADAAREILDEGLDSHGQALNADQKGALEKFADAQSEFAATSDSFDFTLPDLTLSRHLTIYGASQAIEIIHFFPAHTRGDIVVHLRKDKIIATGDILTQPILWTWAAHPSDYIRTLESIRELGAKYLVIGHGGPIIEGQEYLSTALGFMQAIVNFARRSRVAGTSRDVALEQALSDADIKRYQGDFKGADGAMFQQMVQWTLARALDEQTGGEGE